jgi:hypothetical protein
LQLLGDLLHSEEGRAFLHNKGIFTEPTEFSSALKAPARLELSDRLGLAGEVKPVCSGQQIYVDYRFSVLAKIALLHRLEDLPGVAPSFIWHDTDRSGSDSLITKFEWPMRGKTYPIKIAPPNLGEVESRFVELDPVLIEKGLETLKNYVFQSNFNGKASVRQRFADLGEVFTNNSRATLSEFNYRVTAFLLERQMNWNPAALMLSSLLVQEVLGTEVELILNNLAGFIRVYNAAIEDLQRLGIDPQVHFLTEDYLPLFYSCPAENRRLRLQHILIDWEHYAVARCKCGQDYRFFLGEKRLSLGQLAETGRWSPDVSLPVLLNRQVSGLVMGKSSALYGLIMKEVLTKVLGQPPVPFLVPKSFAPASEFPPEFDSLVYHFLAGKEQPSL